jgi:hypothetical protein
MRDSGAGGSTAMGALSGRSYEVRFGEHFEARLVERVPLVRLRRKVRAAVRRQLNSLLRIGARSYGEECKVMVHIKVDGLDEGYKAPCVPDPLGYWVAKTLLYEDDELVEQRGESVQ